MNELLRTSGLSVGFGEASSSTSVLSGVDLVLAPGEAVALTGASGCGKSVLARALLGLLPPAAHQAGRVIWKGEDLTADPRRWAALRGAGMTLVPQEPAAGLDPLLTVGAQIRETLQAHGRRPREAADARVSELLAEVRLDDPGSCARAYPHQLSGGQRQRALLAAALACEPELLIADEPTTALDVTVQRDVLRLIARLRAARGMALLFITHDLDLVPLLADRRLHLADGRLTEQPIARRAASPAHASPPQAEAAPRLEAAGVSFTYPAARNGGAPALRGVDLALPAGAVWGLVGETGCGKTTLARVLTGHLAADGGQVLLDGLPHAGFGGAGGRRRRRRVQLLFQDPGASLNPRQRVGAALAEAAGDASRVQDLLDEVGLARDVAGRHPHELSGGQRQRVALARCLAADPVALVADEPTSALDGAAAERVMDALARAVAERGLALLLVSHDLDLLQRRCARIVVMYAGLVVESFPVGVGDGPRHPYTAELLAAQPALLARDSGAPSDNAAVGRDVTGDAGGGCPYAARCTLRKDRCLNGLPPLEEVVEGHWLRCPEVPQCAPAHFIDTL